MRHVGISKPIYLATSWDIFWRMIGRESTEGFLLKSELANQGKNWAQSYTKVSIHHRGRGSGFQTTALFSLQFPLEADRRLKGCVGLYVCVESESIRGEKPCVHTYSSCSWSEPLRKAWFIYFFISIWLTPDCWWVGSIADPSPSSPSLWDDQRHSGTFIPRDWDCLSVLIEDTLDRSTRDSTISQSTELQRLQTTVHFSSFVWIFPFFAWELHRASCDLQHETLSPPTGFELLTN